MRWVCLKNHFKDSLTLTIPAWLNTYAERHNISCRPGFYSDAAALRVSFALVLLLFDSYFTFMALRVSP